MPRLLSGKVRRAQSPLEIYLHEINDTPLLKAEEERELAYQIDEGDNEARDHMVRANLRLVVKIARGFGGMGLELQDLIAEGNLGLMRAAEGFDPSMNTRFSTYASYWIKQSIKRAQVNTGKTVRVPLYMVELMSKWRGASVKLQEKLGRTPTGAEIGVSLNFSKKVLNVVKEAFRVYTLAPQSGQAKSDWSIDETLMTDDSEAPDADITKVDDQNEILDLLSKMDRRQTAILRMRFGLDDEEPMMLKDIGNRLGLTRERVRQIEKDALALLREKLEAG